MELKLAQFILFPLFLFGIAEASLRAQQSIGPFYDLEMADVSLAELSDITNHKPTEGRKLEQLIGKEMFGSYDGMFVARTYNKFGVRVYGKEAPFNNCSSPIKVLFLGDSFMQGYDDQNTIPYQVATHLKAGNICVMPLNAGFTSYSPVIFIAQARVLLPQLHPDYIVVSIDETDLFDDNYRYKSLIMRDDRRRIVSVKHSKVNYRFLKGLVDIKAEPLYVVRLLSKVYHTYFVMPPIYRESEPARGVRLFDISRMPNDVAKRGYRGEIDFFKNNIAELLELIAEDGPGLKRTVIFRHPHLKHLQAEEGERLWNSVVTDAVSEIALERGVRFVDVQAELAQRFGGEAERYYWKGDMHFNFDGLAVYAAVVAQVLYSELGGMAENGSK